MRRRLIIPSVRLAALLAGPALALSGVHAQPAAEGSATRPPLREIPSSKPNVKRIEVDTQGGTNILVHFVRLREETTVAQVRQALRDQTRLSHDPVHGTQAAYSGSDGRVYLWYPGNETVLAGRWKAEPFYTEFVEGRRVLRRVEEAKVCFQYGANTFNPATGRSGPEWECAPLGAVERYKVDVATGDILGLRSRTQVPFALPRERTTIEALRSRIGL